ncbi:MAG: ABC transporter permease [Verrucomicrobia bacterium]|nr:ABC transporter permease [Verrucomicrobiota bacterium]
MTSGVRAAFRQLVVREVMESIRGSSLGAAWLVLNPLLMMLLYVIVFGVLFGGSFGQVENETSIAFAIGVFIGLTGVGFINESIGKAPMLLLRNRNLVKKVVFPVSLLPAVQLAGSSLALLVNTVLFLVMALVYGGGPSIYMLWLPVMLLPLLLLAVACVYLLSAIAVFFRDLQQITPVLAQIIFWTGGVFFGAAKVMEYPALWAFLQWNPVLRINENLRAVLLWQSHPDWAGWSFSMIFVILFTVFGVFAYRRLSERFADSYECSSRQCHCHSRLSKVYQIPRSGKHSLRGAMAIIWSTLWRSSGSFGKSFHAFHALQPMNLDVARGEALAIIGRNGSGKSTLLQLLAGTLQPTTGSVRTVGRVSACSNLDPVLTRNFLVWKCAFERRYSGFVQRGAGCQNCWNPGICRYR